MRMRFVLGVLAYMLPTFPLGYVWHLMLFKTYYDALDIYRPDVLVPFGLASMVIQGIAWAFIYSRLFAGEPILRGAVKFAVLAAPIAWSFAVLAVGAKHRMASVSEFVAIETGFFLLQYAVVSPLIASAFASRRN